MRLTPFCAAVVGVGPKAESRSAWEGDGVEGRGQMFILFFGFVTLWYLLRVGLNRVPGVCSHGALLLSEDHRVQKVRHHRQVSGITNSDL